MTELIARTLAEKKNENVKANIPGYPKPKRVVRKSTETEFIPEVTSIKAGQFRLFSIVSKDMIHEEETAERWRLFAEYATQNDSLLYIVFPQGLVSEIKKRLTEVGIDAQLWEVSK